LLPNGKVLAAGGANSSALVAVAELYDPSSGTWTATGSLINARYLHSLTLLPNGKVLAAGGLGYNGVPYSSAELFDPASGTWTATGSMVNARYFHKATLLPNGQLLASGGTLGPGGSSYLASAELYNPSSGTWTATGSMATTRGLHTSTLLPTGKVLVSGGYNGGRLSEAELYDPASGIWTVTGSLSVGRDGEPATLLPNGEVLNAGGFNGNYQSIAERYDSKTERFYRVRMVQP
jgi:WD40 repeat protein